MNNKNFNSFILDEDLRFLLDYKDDIWKKFDNKKIFITGATGFFGRNILSSFYFVQKSSIYNFNVTSLIRDKNFFFDPSITSSSKKNFNVIEGGLEKLTQIKNIYDVLIHLADQQATHEIYTNNKISETEIVMRSKKNISYVFDFIHNNDIKSFIYVSSGAVYDKKDIKEGISESDKLINKKNSKYYNFSINKITTEKEIKKEFSKTNLNYYILRAFTFAGPHLFIDKKKFAFVDFFYNCINNKDIIIYGNPSSTRSYLYSYELVIWCLRLISHNSSSGCYNLGSSYETTIQNLAIAIKDITRSKVTISSNSMFVNKNYYVPNTRLIEKKTGLSQKILFKEIVKRYYMWIKILYSF
jgi:dTDP-glucose 4,6-dehydratase